MSGNSQGPMASRHSVKVDFLPCRSSSPQEEMTLRESDHEKLLRGVFNTRIGNYTSLRMPFQRESHGIKNYMLIKVIFSFLCRLFFS